MIESAYTSSNAPLLDHETQQPVQSSLSKKSTIPSFDPYQSPPDLDLARYHGVTKRVYLRPSNQQPPMEEQQACPCCGLPPQGALVPLCGDLSNIYHLGSGYSLYFKLMQYCIGLLLLMFVTSGFYNLISNAAEEDCNPSQDGNEDSDDTTCVKDFILMFSIANKKDSPKLMTAQMVLNLISVIVMMFFFQYVHYQLRKMSIKADDTTVTPSDYTIKISGIDAKMSDEEIKEWIESVQTSEQKVKCRKINRTYNIRRYIKLKKKKDDVEHQYRKTNDAKQHDLLIAQKQQLDKEFQELKEHGLDLTYTVLISFKRAQQAAFVLDQYNKASEKSWLGYFKELVGISTQNFMGKNVFIERAPEPSDILWENLGYNSMQKLKRKIITKLSAGLLIAICFGLITLINWAQASLPNELASYVQILSGIGSLLIIGINTVLGIAIRSLIEQEKDTNYTGYFRGVAESLAVAQFINTAFTTLIAKIVLYNTFKEENAFEDGFDKINFYGKGGLIENMFYVFISNAFLTPILAFFDPLYLWKLYQRQQILKRGENTQMTQQEAHQIFEEPEMDLALKNSLLVKTMLLTAFFAPAVPFALIFAILGLILNYWVDKYLLLRRNIYPISIQQILSKRMLRYLKWMEVAFGMGNLLFVLTLRDSNGTHIYDLVPKGVVFATVGLGLLLVLLPTTEINKRLFPIKDDVTENLTYDAARVQFSTDYEIQNPVTSREGLHDYLKLIKNKKKFLENISKDMKRGAALAHCQKKFMGLLKKKNASQNNAESDTQDFVFLDEYVKNIERYPTLTQRKLNNQATLHFEEVIMMDNEAGL